MEYNNSDMNKEKIARLKNVIMAQASDEEMNRGELMTALIELTLEKALEFGFDKCESHYAGLALIIDQERFINTDERVTRVVYDV